MENKPDFKQIADKVLHGKNATKILFVIGIIGILLIFLSTLGGKKETAEPTASMLTTEQYTQQLEAKLTDLTQQIEGVGSVRIMVTLENGIQYVYANSQKTSANTTLDGSQSQKTTDKNTEERSIVTIDGKNGKEALVVTEKEPIVRGVVVVCEGGDNIHVVTKVTDAITTALNITSNRVSVVKSADLS